MRDVTFSHFKPFHCGPTSLVTMINSLEGKSATFFFFFIGGSSLSHNLSWWTNTSLVVWPLRYTVSIPKIL